VLLIGSITSCPDTRPIALRKRPVVSIHSTNEQTVSRLNSWSVRIQSGFVLGIENGENSVTDWTERFAFQCVRWQSCGQRAWAVLARIILLSRSRLQGVTFEMNVIPDLWKKMLSPWCCQFCEQTGTINIQSRKVDVSSEKLSSQITIRIDFETVWNASYRWRFLLQCSEESHWCDRTLHPVEHP
jgi:hypothetical protein